MAHEAQRFDAGTIVLANWRGDALPREPNTLRPAIVVEDSDLFAPVYPNVVLVPLTDDATLVITDLAVHIEPTPENGCTRPCWAAAHLIATTSKSRLRSTGTRVTAAQLADIRRRISECIGLA